MSFGQPSTTSITSCVSPSLSQNPNYQFNGAIQVWENSASGGNLNILELGHDGANAIIDATGTSSDPLYNRLLINYYCGKDVIIGNVTSGDLTANHNFHVLGDINGSTLAGSGFNLLQSDGTGKIMKVSSWYLISKYISIYGIKIILIILIVNYCIYLHNYKVVNYQEQTFTKSIY